ncbi:MAG: ribonuclease HII [Bdellovibrionales bacterium]
MKLLLNNKKSFKKLKWTEFHPQPAIGVDEAGRGCLFGPVYAGAVILKSEKGLRRFTDSKMLAEEEREELYELIMENHLYGVGSASVQEINQLNILQASLLAMKRAVHALGVKVGHVLIDGNQKIPSLCDPQLGHEFLQTTIIKGDLRVKPIAAASIVAKVSRDRQVRQLALQYSQYGLEQHKGYATQIHREAIVKHGPTPEHRKFFAGVKEYWSETF